MSNKLSNKLTPSEALNVALDGRADGGFFEFFSIGEQLFEESNGTCREVTRAEWASAHADYFGTAQ